jgi:hypothetical protein
MTDFKNPDVIKYVDESLMFRGGCIHQFSYTENFIDNIIVKSHSLLQNNETYIKYRENGKLSIDKKIDLFEICIAKYEKDTNKSFSNIIHQLKEFKRVRDILAHYLLYRDDKAIKAFRENGTLTFCIINPKNDEPKFEVFTQKRKETFLNDLKKSFLALIEIFKAKLDESEGLNTSKPF